MKTAKQLIFGLTKPKKWKPPPICPKKENNEEYIEILLTTKESNETKQFNKYKVIERIHNYIIENVNHEYFELEADPDFKTACKLILTACENEKQYSRSRSRFETFKDWVQGLPSAFNTLYYYNVSAVDMLGAWLEESENEKSKYSESASESAAEEAKAQPKK